MKSAKGRVCLVVRVTALSTALVACLWPTQASSWGTLTGKINIPHHKVKFMREIMIPSYAIDPDRTLAEFDDRRGPHPMHQFLVYQAFMHLQNDPAYKDGLSGFPRGAAINAWDGVEHTDEGMRMREWSALVPSSELAPDISGVGGPSPDAERLLDSDPNFVANAGWNKEYFGTAHYWNPWLKDGNAPVVSAENYSRLVKAIIEGADENTKAHYASYMSHYLADVASAKHADAFTLDIDTVNDLIPIADQFMAERSDNLYKWLKSDMILEALGIIKKRTRFLNSSTSGAYWDRVDKYIGANQIFRANDDWTSAVTIYEKGMTAALATYLHELHNRPDGKSIDQFYTFFDPFYYNGHIFNRPGDWPSFDLAMPTGDHLDWETNPAHYETALKYMDENEPQIMPLGATGRDLFGKFKPDPNYFEADWSEAEWPIQETFEELVKACSEDAHGSITSSQDFQRDPSAHMKVAISYLYTAYRASITSMRIQATAREVGSTGAFKIKCKISNLADKPALLKSLRLMTKDDAGNFVSMSGWSFNLSGKRATNTKPHNVTISGDELPDGVKLDDIYIDLRGDVQDTPDSGWRRTKINERETSIVRNPDSDATLTEMKGPVDVIVVMDTTGSMQSSIDSMRENAIASIQKLQRMTTDIRLAVTTFRDLDEEDDVEFFLVSKFTTALEKQFNFMRDLSADGGGDAPEDQLQGISLGLELWENEKPSERIPTKIIIVVTDAPAKDGDSYGNTFKSIAKRAFEVDPAHIYPIVVGSDSTAMEHAQELAELTGGKVLSAASGDEVADVLIEAVATAVETYGAPAEDRSSKTPWPIIAAFLVGFAGVGYGAWTLIAGLRSS